VAAQQQELRGADWQLRNGATNDHSDKAYDDDCIKRLGELDDEAQPICHSFAEVARRFDVKLVPEDELVGEW